MGTLNLTVTTYGKTKGQGAASVASTYVRTSTAHTTDVTASTVQADSADIELVKGEVIMATGSEAMWINFGGADAAVGVGHYLPAEQVLSLEVDESGTMSAIDVA